MTLFGALGISGSGIDAAQMWIDTSAGNIANANDAVSPGQPAYAEQTPVFTPVAVPGASGDAVEVSGIALGSSAGVLAQDPSSPVADARGEVRLPAVSLSHEMVGLVAAQDTYQANTRALADAKAAYQSALTLGR